jgi:hypothetical protein
MHSRLYFIRRRHRDETGGVPSMTMTTTPHEIRNWLHQLLSSIEAAMPDVTAQCFAQKSALDITTPFPDGNFTEWQPLSDTLFRHLAHLVPGAVRYRLIENVSRAGDTLPLQMPLPLEITWQVAFFRRGTTALVPLICHATLIREAGDLVAERLHCLPPPPPEPEVEAETAPSQSE